jgi:uncharacterized membrane protein
MWAWVALLGVSVASLALSLRTVYLMTCASSCDVVMSTPYARVFGFPNAALAAVYYAALIAFCGLRLAGIAVPWWPALAASGLSLVMTAYLAWALTFRVRRWCSYCVAGYASTVAAAVCLLILWRQNA